MTVFISRYYQNVEQMSPEDIEFVLGLRGRKWVVREGGVVCVCVCVCWGGMGQSETPSMFSQQLPEERKTNPDTTQDH